MGEGQPVGQLSRGFIRGLPVKGHHGGRHTWRPEELGAPPIADGRNLDQIRAPADGFFETMCDHGCVDVFGERALILRATWWRSSEAQREGSVHTPMAALRRDRFLKKYLRWRVVNRICTRHPQVFHIPRLRTDALLQE
jgi:hypothetical protein